ncbi:MAG: hypothetical protein J0H68_04105 [Sphingobacteriia bacterium]|nr:hypothetical protein [Sphingobacteriia bacterium]
MRCKNKVYNKTNENNVKKSIVKLSFLKLNAIKLDTIQQRFTRLTSPDNQHLTQNESLIDITENDSFIFPFTLKIFYLQSEKNKYIHLKGITEIVEIFNRNDIRNISTEQYYYTIQLTLLKNIIYYRPDLKIEISKELLKATFPTIYQKIKIDNEINEIKNNLLNLTRIVQARNAITNAQFSFYSPPIIIYSNEEEPMEIELENTSFSHNIPYSIDEKFNMIDSPDLSNDSELIEDLVYETSSNYSFNSSNEESFDSTSSDNIISSSNINYIPVTITLA